MKFGKLLSQRMVPEWSDRYIRYKMMKGQLKSISAARESYLHAFEKLKGPDPSGIAIFLNIFIIINSLLALLLDSFPPLVLLALLLLLLVAVFGPKFLWFYVRT